MRKTDILDPIIAPLSPSIVVVVLGLVATLTGVGCRPDWQSDTYPATGRITINGEAPAGAVVELHSVGEQPDVRDSRPWAVVQEDGSYSLTTYETGDGAPLGEYAVTVKWPPDVSKPSLVDRLGGVYARPESSAWKVSISDGDNELPPITITGARVLPKEHAGAPRRAPPGPEMSK